MGAELVSVLLDLKNEKDPLKKKKGILDVSAKITAIFQHDHPELLHAFAEFLPVGKDEMPIEACRAPPSPEAAQMPPDWLMDWHIDPDPEVELDIEEVINWLDAPSSDDP